MFILSMTLQHKTSNNFTLVTSFSETHINHARLVIDYKYSLAIGLAS